MKIALIGCGNWGKFILRDLLTLGAEVQVVARSESSINNARELGITDIVSTISELTYPQGIIVATTISSHYSVIEEVAEYFPNIPIFCEKPLTNSYAEAKKLLAQYPNNIFVMDKWRYHQGVIALRDLYQSGEYGALKAIYTTRLSMSNPHMGDDPVWVLLPHDLSILNEILGFIPPARSAQAIIYQDQFESLSCQLGDKPWVQIDVSARSTKRERRMELRFEQHILVLTDGYANQIEVYTWDPKEQSINPNVEFISFKEEMPLLAELEAFVNYLNNKGEKPKSSLKDGVLVVERIEELMKLAKSSIS